MKIKPAFTMIELVFVIVVLGILASVAIPKFAATRDDAIIAKGRTEVAAIRSAIMTTKQKRILQGKTASVPRLDDVDTYNIAGVALFGGYEGNETLTYPIYKNWIKTGTTGLVNNDTYTFTILNSPVTFTYDFSKGTFDCNHAEQNCKLLTE